MSHPVIDPAIAIGVTRVQAALNARAGKPWPDSNSLSLKQVADSATRIEQYTCIQSRWPKLFHPLLRALEVKKAQRESARAIDQLAIVLANQQRTLGTLAGRIRQLEQAGPGETPPSPRPRLLFDVTYTNRTDHKTGIQRVIRNLARELHLHPHGDTETILVKITNGAICPANDFAAKIGCPTAAHPDAPLTLTAHDTYLVLESGWAMNPEYEAAMAEVRRHGGAVVGGIHDLIPLTMPDIVPPEAHVIFAEWLAILLHYSTSLICVSRTVAEEVQDYVGTRLDISGRKIPIGYFHNGVDETELRPLHPAGISPRVAAIRASAGTLILMVGTIEPRKGYAAALDACDALWAQNADVTLCLVGKPGWAHEKILARIHRHPQLGRRLHFCEGASDGELAELYTRADALLFASLAEGFGLPLIEAAKFDIPIICSDLPVFREVCGAHATYFAPGHAHDLTTTLVRWIAEKNAGRTRRSAGIPYLHWNRSADMLKASIFTGTHAVGHVGR